jgi:hypothetical protein
MNSIKANATLIELYIEESIKGNYIKIIIKDNGKGMTKEILERAVNPFYTTRTTRKVGLGLSLLKEACERCKGIFNIESEPFKGTIVSCSFERDNIDRAPMGSLADTVMTIINDLNDCELVFTYTCDEGKFELDTRMIKNILESDCIRDNNILLWIKDYVNENLLNFKTNKIIV